MEAHDLAIKTLKDSQKTDQEFDEKLTMEYLQLQFTTRMLEFFKSDTLSTIMGQDKQTRAIRYHVDSTRPLTYFQGFVGPGTMFESGKEFRLADIPDGLGETILIVEAFEPVAWTKPGGIRFDPAKRLPELGGLGFKDVFHIATVDGSVKAVKRSAERQRLKKMITRNGSEPLR